MSRIASKVRPLAASIALVSAANPVHAAGFSVPEISIAGLATSNALVANPDLLGAIPYNPSLAAFHPGTQVSGGVTVVHAESQVTTGTGTFEFQGKDNVPIPMLQVTHQLNEQWTLGLGTTAPFGLSTKHDPAAYPALGSSAPTKSAVEVVDIAPTATYKINENTAIAFGADIYWAKTVNFDTASLQNEGDGIDWGWNISASHRNGPLSFGASFRSESEIDIEGRTTVVGLGSFNGTEAKLTVPWRAQIGARYEFTDRFAFEADISRTGWSSFDTLTINTTSPAGTITSENNWKDQNSYRLSATYQIDPSLQLRFGYTYDETGQPIELFSARTADADRQLFSVGLEKKLDNGLAIEAGYMLVKFDDTTLNATGFTIPGEPNGSLLYNGKYETTVHLFGIGVSKSFDL